MVIDLTLSDDDEENIDTNLTSSINEPNLSNTSINHNETLNEPNSSVTINEPISSVTINESNMQYLNNLNSTDETDIDSNLSVETSLSSDTALENAIQQAEMAFNIHIPKLIINSNNSDESKSNENLNHIVDKLVDGYIRNFFDNTSQI